jgi:hypothetical protein
MGSPHENVKALLPAAEPPEVVTRLYRAFAAADAQGLACVLHPRFAGRVSAGMPLGVGGSAFTPEQMLLGVWAKVFSTFEVAPIPEEYVVVGPGQAGAGPGDSRRGLQ